MKQNKKKLNYVNGIELFAGAGGMALGFSNAGIKHKLLIDFDKYSVETLKKNFKTTKIIKKDISKINDEMIKKIHKNIGEIQIISAGLPCQPFSYAGKKRGFFDTRGILFYDFMRFVDIIKPKIFIIENVKGLVTNNKGETFKKIKNEIYSRDYFVKWKILNANDYGVPQKRNRLFIACFKHKKNYKKFEWPEKDLYKPVLKDFIMNLKNNSEGSNYNEKKKKIFKIIPPGGNWKNLPLNIAKKYMKKSFYSGGGKTGIARRMSYNEPSLTLTTSPQQNQTERCHPEFIRPFTILEYSLIQTFPKKYKFEGSITQKYKQIGNAVPVLLAEKIANSLILSLKKENSE